MHTEHHGEVHHHRNRQLAKKAEGMVGVLMVVAIAILAVGLVYGILSTGSAEPSWMR